jgi:hypothetical protein
VDVHDVDRPRIDPFGDQSGAPQRPDGLEGEPGTLREARVIRDRVVVDDQRVDVMPHPAQQRQLSVEHGVLAGALAIPLMDQEDRRRIGPRRPFGCHGHDASDPCDVE